MRPKNFTENANLMLSCRAYYYIQYTDQQMRSINYNKIQIIKYNS